MNRAKKKPTRQNTLGYSIASAYLLTGLLELSGLPFIESSVRWAASLKLKQHQRPYLTPFPGNSNRLSGGFGRSLIQMHSPGMGRAYAS